MGLSSQRAGWLMWAPAKVGDGASSSRGDDKEVVEEYNYGFWWEQMNTTSERARVKSFAVIFVSRERLKAYFWSRNSHMLLFPSGRHSCRRSERMPPNATSYLPQQRKTFVKSSLHPVGCSKQQLLLRGKIRYGYSVNVCITFAWQMEVAWVGAGLESTLIQFCFSLKRLF